MSQMTKRKEVLNILDIYFEGIFNNDISEIPLDKNVTLQGPLIPEPLIGREDVIEFLSDVAASFSNAQYHVVRDVIDGDHVFTLVKIRLSQGQILDMGYLFELQGGKIKSIQTLYDPRIMLE